MPSNQSQRAKLVKCPYFRKEDGQRSCIRCEGVGDALYTELNFGGRNKARLRQMSVFCQSVSNCKKCEIYRMIEESKYSD